MILVTGATGYVGRNLVSRLVRRGDRVRCLVRQGSPKLGLLRDLSVELSYGDVTDESSLAQAMDGVDAVVHTVAIIREKGGQTYARINHQGTRNVVLAAQRAGVKRLVHVSAIGASNSPAYAYLYSKWLGEEEVKASEIPWVILRPSFLFEEGEEFFTTLACVVKALPVVPIIGNGKSLFQPIALSDVLRCIEAGLDSDIYNGRVIELGGPERISYEGIMDLVMETIGHRRPKVHIPTSLMRPLVALMDTLLPYPPVTRRQLAMLPLDNVPSGEPVEPTFGFLPRPLRGNLNYLRKITYREALATVLGFRAWH